MFGNTTISKLKLGYAILIDSVMDRFKSFKVSDIAIFKVCLFSLGTLFGAMFSKEVKKAKPLIVLLALVSYIYLVYKVFFEE